jgi:hypothetical protein
MANLNLIGGLGVLSASCILSKIHYSFFGGLWEWWEWDYLIGAVVTSQYPVE